MPTFARANNLVSFRNSAVPLTFSNYRFSKRCCGPRQSSKSVVRQLGLWVPNFKMLLWPTPESKSRCTPKLGTHSYHQNRKKNNKEMPRSWSLPFLSPGARRPFWRNFLNNSKPFLVCLILPLSVYVSKSYSYLGRSSHFPALMTSLFLTNIIVFNMSFGNTHIFGRPWIGRFCLNFMFVTCPY